VKNWSKSEINNKRKVTDYLRCIINTLACFTGCSFSILHNSSPTVFPASSNAASVIFFLKRTLLSQILKISSSKMVDRIEENRLNRKLLLQIQVCFIIHQLCMNYFLYAYKMARMNTMFGSKFAVARAVKTRDTIGIIVAPTCTCDRRNV
jgi:hypothetical protein